jgi:hypothetical protein
MAIIKNIGIATFVLALSLSLKAQTIEKTFSGSWAETWWTFDFYKNGTYKRTSSGHYGATEVKGSYKTNQDTIQLLTGYKNSDGTINEYYLFEKDSFLIDITLLYDYKLTKERNLISYNSRKRYDILQKPDPNLRFHKSLAELDSLVETAIHQLKNTTIWLISDAENLNIIRLLNTIYGSSDKRLTTGVYAEFRQLIFEKNYIEEIRKVYDWTIGTGMGFLILKLQVELGGSPNWYSIYVIE